MNTIYLMESSSNYNNHHVTIKQDGETLFDTYLMAFNNTPLASKLESLVSNKTIASIPALDVYGYAGELSDTSIISELEAYNEAH